jgi:U1 small nuclear ribonucleoprotein
MTSMNTNNLPPAILALFAPRKPLPFLPPIEKSTKPYFNSISTFLDEFEDPERVEPPPPWNVPESRRQKQNRIKSEREQNHQNKVMEQLGEWEPEKDPKIHSVAENTLFIGRIPFEMTETDLSREFEPFGRITSCRIVRDVNTNKSRGYGFVEFEHVLEMKKAAQTMDGKRIGGRKILVDTERGRTQSDWKPRRLGGGLGESRKSIILVKKPKETVKQPERRVGGRGRGRGGFRGRGRGGDDRMERREEREDRYRPDDRREDRYRPEVRREDRREDRGPYGRPPVSDRRDAPIREWDRNKSEYYKHERH